MPSFSQTVLHTTILAIEICRRTLNTKRGNTLNMNYLNHVVIQCTIPSFFSEQEISGMLRKKTLNKIKLIVCG